CIPWVSPAFILVHILWLVPVIFLATLASGTHDPKDIGKAIYTYILLSVGVFTILISVLPLIASLLSMQWMSLGQYAALAVLLLLGSALMIILSRRMCAVVIPTAAAVTRAIFFCFFYLVGVFLCFGGFLLLLSGSMEALLGDGDYEPMAFWVLPASLFLTGGGLLLGLRFANENKFRAVCELPLNRVSSKIQPPSPKRSRTHG
ncbi:MAG: hypothetical protein AAB853_03690, partial [Patescibacteria group bacterium]